MKSERGMQILEPLVNNVKFSSETNEQKTKIMRNPGLSPDTAESGAWKRPDPQEGYSDSQ